MERKRKPGDRRDGVLLRDLDSMHFIVPLIHPNRCDNEAFISERIDLEKLNAYLEEKNANTPEYRYNLFQAIVTAVLKTIMLRPKLNRFIVNGNTYARNELTAAFVIKKIFTDESEGGLAIIHAKQTDTIDTIHDEIYRRVSYCRKDNQKDGSTESMDLLNKMPRFFAKFLVRLVRILDRYGMVPKSLISSDPYYATVVLSNLGSIRLKAGYHHLVNWGTNSVFVTIGEKKIRPFYDAQGNMTMHDSVDLGLTIDERLADGYYYSKTIRLLKTILENPALLERPMGEEVEVS